MNADTEIIFMLHWGKPNTYFLDVCPSNVGFYALQKKTIFNLYVRYSYSSHISWPFWILFKEISYPPELSNLVGTASHLFLFCFINLLGNIHINVYALSMPYKVLPFDIADSSWTPAVKFIMSFLVSLHNILGLEQGLDMIEMLCSLILKNRIYIYSNLKYLFLNITYWSICLIFCLICKIRFAVI